MKQIKPKLELQKEEFEELRCKSMVIRGVHNKNSEGPSGQRIKGE